MNPLLSLGLLSLALPGARAPAGGQDLFRDLSFESAQAQASELELPLLVELESADPAETAAFDAAVWSDAKAVRYVEVEVLPVRYGGAEADRLAVRYGVEARPAVLVLEADGQELLRLVPPLSSSRFVRNLRLLTAHRGEISAARRAAEARPDDFEIGLAYAQTLTRVRLFGPALVEFERIWEFGHDEEGFRKEHLAFVVRTVANMITDNPKARNTLARWRERAVATLARASAEPTAEHPAPTLRELMEAASEVGAINAQLDNREHSLQLYAQLGRDPNIPPEVLYALFNRHVFRLFYNDKRFADLIAGCGDVFLRADQAFNSYEEHLRLLNEGQLPADREYLVDALRKAATAQVGIYYEALLQTGKTEEAVQLADVVCNRYPLGETYVELMSAAKRAGARDEIRRLGEQALGRLQGSKEKAGVREVLEKTFPREH